MELITYSYKINCKTPNFTYANFKISLITCLYLIYNPDNLVITWGHHYAKIRHRDLIRCNGMLVWNFQNLPTPTINIYNTSCSLISARPFLTLKPQSSEFYPSTPCSLKVLTRGRRKIFNFALSTNFYCIFSLPLSYIQPFSKDSTFPTHTYKPLSHGFYPALSWTWNCFIPNPKIVKINVFS